MKQFSVGQVETLFDVPLLATIYTYRQHRGLVCSLFPQTVTKIQ